jgi:hypothetical protein
VHDSLEAAPPSNAHHLSTKGGSNVQGGSGFQEENSYGRSASISRRGSASDRVLLRRGGGGGAAPPQGHMYRAVAGMRGVLDTFLLRAPR